MPHSLRSNGWGTEIGTGTLRPPPFASAKNGGTRFLQGDDALAKKGIKIKELAGELGVTSRQLIDRCRAEGLSVQNSVTKLPPADEHRVRAWFAEDGTCQTGNESEQASHDSP